MKISDIGGEFELIKRISKNVKDNALVKGIGDDTAVIKYNDKEYLLFTTDMLVENDHFSLKWSTPYQIGMKSIEANVSDIAAMGGMPKYAIISLCLAKNISVELIDELYRGIYASCKRNTLHVIGGDMTHGSSFVINIAMLGFVERKNLCLRGDAKVNDLICVTGNLGGSTAGLRLFLKEKTKDKTLLKEHLEPKAELKKARIIAKYANAMIDVSDGLAPEVRHICEESNKGAVIYKEKIPISKKTRNAASMLNENPYDYALYGGEDFEIVFTTKNPPKNATIVGKILPSKQGIYLLDNGIKKKLKKGFDHFS